MCGLAGIIGSNANNSTLLDMLKIQNHRGPDYTGKWNENSVVLGHNRLSIIDLSSDANQPFTDVEERYILIFNGEIYNYLELREELKEEYNFNTNSDTEVLFAAYIKWGKQCLKKLNGMFAFAIWDREEEKLFAARDRFGVKPFYYHKNTGSFYFSSEIKAIHAAEIDKRPNEFVWANYFVYGSYGMPNETFWEGISQLPGGHYLELANGELEISKWYYFEEEIKKYRQEESFEKVKENYTILLKKSIELRFRSDVSVGFNISGGLDSSALLAFVNEFDKKEKINAFTFYTNDSRYDELPWVEEMIEFTKNPLEKVLLRVEEVKRLAESISNIQDEPYGGIPTLAYAKIFQRARENGVLVLLDGQGMDEQWAGYDYYMKVNDATIQGVQNSPFRKNVLSKTFLSKAKKPCYPEPFEDPLLNKQYRDLFYTKIPRTLRFNDRVSMAYSTELREPFLDYRLVEYAFSQPLSYKIKDGVQKYMLREIVSEYLNDSISYAPKRPLQTPQREWLGENLENWIESAIKGIEESPYVNWFDIPELKKEWGKYKKGKKESSFHIWQWLNFHTIDFKI